MSARLPTLLACALLGLVASAARAQTPEHVTAHLELETPSPDCPTPAEVATGVEERLDRDVFVDEERAHVRVIGRVAPRGETSWGADLRMETRAGRVLGTREILSEHPDCGALRDSLPLVVALLVDVPLEHVRLVLPPPSAGPRDAEPAPEQPGAPRVATTGPAPGPGESWRWEVALALRGATGRLPGVALGPSVHAGATTPFGLRLEAGVEAAWSTDRGAGPGGTFADVVGRVAACPVLELGRARVAGCLGVAGGWLWARPRDLDYGQTQRRRYAEVRAWLEGELGLTAGLFGRLAVGVGAPLTRHRFHFSLPGGEERRVHEIAAITPFAEISLGWEGP